MSEYFPEPSYLGTYVKVDLDLSNYETITDLKNKQVLIHHLFPKF